MEDRYRRMSKIGVRNIASYNERAKEALAKGEHFERTVQTGFDDAGRATYESEKIRPEPMRSSAAGTPTSRGRRCVPPAPGTTPSLTSGNPSCAPATTRR